MKATPLGRTLGLIALALFCVGFVVGSIAPAIAALVLLAFRDAAGRGVHGGTITASHHVPAVVAAGQPFEMEIDASSDEPVPLTIVDDDPRLEILSEAQHQGRGDARLVRTVQAPTPGRLEWDHVTVHSLDPWGLWSTPHRVNAPARLKVAPDAAFVDAGKRAGRRNVVQESVKDPQASLRGLDVRTIRPFMPGDKARDIDWRITTTTGQIHARQRDPEGPRRIITFMDATRSMRRPARIPKLRSATNVATGIAGAAQGAGVSASLVAFHETGVISVGNATSASGISDIVQGLAALPTVEGAEDFRLTTDIDRAVTGDERRFMQLVSTLSHTPVPAAPSLDQALDALSRLSGGPAFVVAIMDGEVNPRRVEVAVGRLQSMGHDVLVVIPATGPHHCTKEDAPIEDLREAMARRKQLGRTLAARKVRMLVLHPGTEDEVIREVSRSAV